MTLKVKVLEQIRDVTAAQWNALLPEACPPVMRWQWLDALEASGSATAERGWQPQHLTLWRDEALIGAAPAWRKFHSMGEYVYDFGWANAAQSMGIEYYPKFLIGVPLSPLTAPRFLAAPGESLELVRSTLLSAAIEVARDCGCSSVHVIFPHESEAQALVEAGLHQRSSMQYHWKNPGYRTYDDYLSRFDSKRRNQLKREQGAAEKQGITLSTVRSHELTGAHAEYAWRFYEHTAGRHAWGPAQLTQGFFHRAFAAMPDAIELVIAQKDQRVIAGAFNLHTPSRLYGRYWGCFEEHPFLHFNVCLYHSVADCIRAGRQVFEPGAGGEHKISRGFEPTRIHSVHRIFNKRLDAAVYDFCRREALEVLRITSESEEISGMKPWVSQG